MPVWKMAVLGCAMIFAVPRFATAQNADFFCGAGKNQVCTFALYGSDGLAYRFFPVHGRKKEQVSGINFGQDVFCIGINYRPPDHYVDCSNAGNYMKRKGAVLRPPTVNS